MELVHYKLLSLSGFFLGIRLLLGFINGIPEKIRKTLSDYAEGGIVACLVSLVLITFVFQISRVEGDSMYPTLEDGQYTIVNKLVYRLHPPERGDIVVFRAPQEPSKDYVKRIIGLPGEKIAFHRGHVLINGLYLQEPYLSTLPDYEDPPPLRVPQDHYYVLGDNRANSEDSHQFGPIPKESIRGKASLIIYPFSEFGLVKGLPPKRFFYPGSQNPLKP